MTTASHVDSAPLPDHAVIVHLDEGVSDDAARDWAAGEAATEGRPLVLVATVPTSPGTAITLAFEREGAEAFVDAAAAEMRRRHPGLEVHTLVVSADALPTLLELSVGAQVVVIGAHSRAVLVKDWGFDAAVAARTTCPVVVVPRGRGLVRRGVLAGVDLRAQSAEVLDFAFRHASLHGLPLTVLSCSRTGGSVEDEWQLAEVTAGLQERFPDVHVTREVRRGRPAAELIRSAELMDLLVVGRHQPTGFAHSSRGHVRTGVVDRARCPVAVVPVSA